MTTYRIRLEVPSQSSSPPALTERLGSLGGDVVSVDLHEVDGARAIDEIIVDFPREPDGHTLSRVLEEDPSTTLLSSKRFHPDEPVTHARDWALTNATRDTDAVDRTLSDRLSVACPLAKVTVRSAGDADSLPVVQMALARGGPVVQRCAEVPPDVATRGARSSSWFLAVADDYPAPVSIALLARPMSLRFTANEVARVEVLMGTKAS